MEPGTQIGAYRLLQRIGEGGMGLVWLAEHVALGRRAALKLLHAEYSSRAEIVTRFFNEARAATAIADPGIVQIFDFGQHVDGSAYIVMELLDGEPLDRRLQRLGALAPRDALRIMRQVASTLGAAHARGIVHRDLKPENIFIVRDPEVPGGERAKVLDFGIAKLSSDQAGVKTHTAAVMGTPTYMSPEQCRGAGQVDARSDVYALGCVLFTLVVGRPPFDAEGVGDIIAMHLREPAPAPSSRRPGVPPELDALVLRCLAKDPSQRLAHGGELATAIGALLGSSPGIDAAASAGPIAYAAGSPPTTLSSASGIAVAAAPTRRSRGVVVAGGLVLAGGAVTVAIFATRGPAESSPTAAPPTASAQIATLDASPPTKPDPKLAVTAAMKDAVSRFARWSNEHVGAACPDSALLGLPEDPWGHPFRVTCIDQPGDQMVGVISSGADGAPGTADDVASWQLGRDVTELARGPRWVAAQPAPAQPAVAVVKKHRAPERPRPAPAQPVKPGKTIELDENGLPISR